MSINSLFIAAIIFCFGLITAKASDPITHKSENSLSIINKSLEDLEIKLKSTNYGDACLEALKIAKLIEDNIDILRTLEPNYNWPEIRSVLLKVPEEYCSKSN